MLEYSRCAQRCETAVTARIPEQSANDDVQAPPGERARLRRRWRTAVAAAILAVAAGIAFGVYQYLQPPAPATVYAVAFDGRTPFAVVDAGSVFRLENVSTGQLTASLGPLAPVGPVSVIGVTSNLLVVAFSPDGKMVGLEYNGGHTGVWDAATGRSIATFPDPPGGASALAFSHDDKTLAVATSDDRVYLWGIAARNQVAMLASPDRAPSPAAVAFSPSGRILAMTGGNGNLYLWDVATRKLAATIDDSYGWLAFSPDSTMLATTDPICCDETKVWSLATRRAIANLGFPGGNRDVLAFGPDGMMLVTGNVYGGAVLWSIATHQPIARFTDTTATPAPAVTAVAFSPDGQTIAVGDTKGHVILWKVRKPGS
jgi:WD40 repeat protein